MTVFSLLLIFVSKYLYSGERLNESLTKLGGEKT